MPRRSPHAKCHFVYLVLANDGSYYCGYAADPDARVRAHNAGKGAKILRGKRPVKLAYARRFSNKSAALQCESRLKRRSHAHKRELARRWRARARR